VDTPQGSRNKFKLDPDTGLFKLGFVMPLGMEFPFDFGFIPSTQGEDGDPLDVLVLMDAPTFVGCVVPIRLVGVLESRQKEKAKAAERNDRLIAVALPAARHGGLRSLRDFSPQFLDEIEHFFVSYNEIRNRKFTVLARKGPDVALKLIKRGVQLFAEKEGKS
jgi:inorganic pyrophosphatase